LKDKYFIYTLMCTKLSDFDESKKQYLYSRTCFGRQVLIRFICSEYWNYKITTLILFHGWFFYV